MLALLFLKCRNLCANYYNLRIGIVLLGFEKFDHENNKLKLISSNKLIIIIIKSKAEIYLLFCYFEGEKF